MGHAVTDKLYSVFVSSFFGEIFAKFWAEKYGFDCWRIQRNFDTISQKKFTNLQSSGTRGGGQFQNMYAQ
jgi:hypothetical protein